MGKTGGVVRVEVVVVDVGVEGAIANTVANTEAVAAVGGTPMDAAVTAVMTRGGATHRQTAVAPRT